MQKLHKLPIYKKSLQILQLTEALCTTIPDDDIVLETTTAYMMENAMIIPAKIVGAEGVDLYDLKMECATIIRKAARDLLVQAGSLQYEENKNDYPDLLRNEIDEFRLLFVEWVASFKKSNFINDNWGLFNPPGLEP